MLIREWIEAWEKRVPTRLQEDWDNSGLQAGRIDKELRGLVFSLDVTQEAIDKAKEIGANLLVTHHPILFQGAKEISERRKATAYILDCIEQGITIYAAHTNFDRVIGGVNDILADLCGLTDVAPLEEPSEAFEGHTSATTPPAQTSPTSLDGGMGRIGRVAKTSLDSFADSLKEALSLDHLIVYGDGNKEISKVATMGGSGASYADLARDKGCDLLVTGDVKYHDAVDAVEAGLSLIDLGHYESEQPAAETMILWSKEISPDIPHALVRRNEMSRRRIR